MDGLLGVAMAVLAALDVTLSGDWLGPTWINALVIPVLGLSLAWRRIFPLSVLAFVLVGFNTLGVAYGSSQAWASIFIVVIAVYSVAAHGTRPLVGLGVLAAGIVVRDLNDPYLQGFGDAVWASTLLGLTFLAGVEGRLLGQRRRALDARTEALEREEEALAAAAAAAERDRIARELHDIISHGLGVMVLQAGAASEVLDRDPERVRETLASVRHTGQEAIDQMGTLLGLVRGDTDPSRAPQPRLRDLPTLVERMRDAGLDVELTTEGDERPLPLPLELSAYRIVQEGLTNASKHAGPARVRVVVHHADRHLRVEVTDDGLGSPAGGGSRRGLAGIAERVAVFGGELSAGPRPAGGWTLAASFPLAP